MTKHITVIMTAPNEEEGASIAKTLVEEKLLACVNIIPKIRSIYRWEGKICDEAEVMLIGKTGSMLAAAVVKRVKELHSYDVPEVICLPITTGSGDYLHWIEESVSIPTEAEEEGEL